MGGLADRAAGAAGIAGALLIGAFITLAEPSGSPEHAASELARGLVENRDSARVGAYAGLLAVFLLIAFVSRLFAAVRAASNGNSWLPAMTLISGTLLLGVLLIEIGFTFASSELASYGNDPQVAKLFILWTWNSANLLAPAFAALLLSATAASFSADAFPTWFRWSGAVLLVLLLLIAGVVRARACNRTGNLMDHSRFGRIGIRTRSQPSDATD